MQPALKSPVANFNSIKVRLKREQDFNFAFVTEFQFHKGTIKTSLADAVVLEPSAFQFHKGTIKTKPP